MEIPVYVEPVANGFRATTGSPLALTAEAPTADAALEGIRAQISERLKNGGRLRTLHFTDIDFLTKATTSLAENPMFDEYLQSIEEYRREHNTVPDVG